MVSMTRYQNKKYEHGRPEYALTAIFNVCCLTHRMTMMVSYRLLIYKLKSHEAYKGKSCGPGGILCMVKGINLHYQKRRLFIFPAWLKHWVNLTLIA